jgi:NADPH:quinone reductase
VPLAAFTAATGLYHYLQLTPPWQPSATPTPLIVYGASSAVGAYVVKLARRSNIHPIIAIAGSGRPFVEGLIDASKGDTILDYCQGQDHIISGVGQVLHDYGLPAVMHGFDCISTDASLQLMAQLLAPNGHGTFVLIEKDYSAVAEKILQTSLTFCGYVHTRPFPADAKRGITFNPSGNGHDFGAVCSSLFTRGLQDGWLTAHPYEVVPGGLQGLATALRSLKDGQNSAKKYVIRIEETATE